MTSHQNTSMKLTSLQPLSSLTPSLPSELYLTCPHCTSSNILLSSISTSPHSKKPQMKITCEQCQTQKTIDIEKYINFLLSNHTQFHNCFKHNDIMSSFHCSTCDLFMCDLCYSYHQIFQAEHQSEYHLPEKSGCPIHPQMTLDFLCEDCNENICVECGKKYHSGHHVIQLREYWENVNLSLEFKTKIEVKDYIDREIKKYDSTVKEQIDSIETLIASFQHLKAVIETNHSKAIKNNKIVRDIVVSMYNKFFMSKYHPEINTINTIKSMNIGKMIIQEDLIKYNDIIKNIKLEFSKLNTFHSVLSERLIIQERERGNEIIVDKPYLNRKHKKDTFIETYDSKRKKQSSIYLSTQETTNQMNKRKEEPKQPSESSNDSAEDDSDFFNNQFNDSYENTFDYNTLNIENIE